MRLPRLAPAPYVLFVVAASFVLAVSIGGAVSVGAVGLPARDVVFSLLGMDGASSVAGTIVRDLRLPRILLAALVGGSLAVTGGALQAVMRSVLADPYVLGVSSGASVGVALVLVLGVVPLGLGDLLATTAAFISALASAMFVYFIARCDGRLPAVRLLLAGVAFSAFATAATGLILYLAPEAEQVRSIVFWLMGGFGAARWSDVASVAAIVLPGSFLLVALWRWQNLLLLGDGPAETLGLDVRRARSVLIVIAALMTAATVAHAGAVGFVGLVVPHALRPATGPDHRRLLPAAFVVGAIMLVWMDVLCRTLIAPRELPVGILTGLVGAPFFLMLLRKQDHAVAEQ